jgi:hypothetical protein
MSETQSVTPTEPENSVATGGTLQLVKRAAMDGAADARDAAARTWSSIGLFTCRFAYTSCYTISYGVVFPSMLLAHAIPKDNAAVRGLIDGAQAAMLAVDRYHGAASDAAPEASPSLAPA